MTFALVDITQAGNDERPRRSFPPMGSLIPEASINDLLRAPSGNISTLQLL